MYATLCGRAAGERCGRAHFVPLSLNPTNEITICGNNQNEEAGSMGVGVGLSVVIGKYGRGPRKKVSNMRQSHLFSD